MTLRLVVLWLLAISVSWGHAAAQEKSREQLEQELANTRAALAQLAATSSESSHSGASSSPATDCERVLRTLTARLAELSTETQRQTEGLSDKVETATQFVTVGTEQIRQAQDAHAVAAQAAVDKVAADAKSGQLTQILGFLTVMATIGIRAWTERAHHSETAGRLDALGQAFQQKKNEVSGDGKSD